MGEWVDLEADAKTVGSVQEPVRFGLLGYRGAKHIRGRVMLRADVVEALQLETHRVAIRIGRGLRAHQISIVGQRDGPFELLPCRSPREPDALPKTFRVNLPVVEHWPAQSLPLIGRSYKLETEGKHPVLGHRPAEALVVRRDQQSSGPAVTPRPHIFSG